MQKQPMQYAGQPPKNMGMNATHMMPNQQQMMQPQNPMMMNPALMQNQMMGGNQNKMPPN